MEYKLRIESPNVIMEPMLALLEDAEHVPLQISGNSMSPFLVHGRDTVYLSKPRLPLKKGDMVLYQRTNGAYVLHRIQHVTGDSYTMVGDAQVQLEPGICCNQIRAVVTAVRRKDKLLQKGNFWWDFFEKVWICIIPLRRPIIKLYSIVCPSHKKA